MQAPTLSSSCTSRLCPNGHLWIFYRRDTRSAVYFLHPRPILKAYTHHTYVENDANACHKYFSDHWTVLYEIPSYNLIDSEVQFARNFFTMICALLGVMDLTTTACHPQTKGQAERYNKTILTCLRRCVAEHQKGWDTHPCRNLRITIATLTL